MAKTQRQHKISQLLEKFAVTSQTQLVELLAGEKVVATQATVSRDLEELGAVKDADAVFTDVWASMGQEKEAAERRDKFAGFMVDHALMSQAKPDALFLHCLPAHRDEEVAASVVDGPQSVVWPEAENRLHAMRGLLLWLFQEAR